MSGTKRTAKGNPKPISHAPPMDLGSTPPYALPPTYHQESALRYTQTPAVERTVNPRDLLQRSATEPRITLSQNTVNKQAAKLIHDTATRYIPQTRIPVTRPIISPLTQDRRDDSDDEIEVDTDDDRDAMYMLNTGEGSYSRQLDSDDDDKLPDQAVLALQHLKRAQELSAQQLQHGAGSGNDDMKEVWRTDLLLRNVVRRIKQRLRDGGNLTLERLDSSAGEVVLTCAHPLCPAPERRMPDGAYYITLSSPHMREKPEQYCLFCLEDLWNGKGMVAPFPEAEVVERVSSYDRHMDGLALGLDGAMDELALGLDGAVDDDRFMTAGILPSSSIGERSSTPLTRSSVNSGKDGMTTPATRHTSSAAPSPVKSAFSGDEGCDSATSPVATGEPSSSASGAEHITLARKRGVNHITALASSQALREANKSAAIPRELREGFGEAFLNGQAAAATSKRGGSAEKFGRRSARLQSVEQVSEDAASPVTARSGQTKSTNPQTELASTPMQVIGEAAAKAEQKLAVLYEQRDLALRFLGPGESAFVRAPGGRKSAGPHVGRDAFGVPHTDYLAEPVKYWIKPDAMEYEAEEVELERSSLAGPMPGKIRGAAVEQRSSDSGDSALSATSQHSSGVRVDVETMFGSPNLNARSSHPYDLQSAQMDGTHDFPHPLQASAVQHPDYELPQYDGPPDPPKPSPLRNVFIPASLMESRHAPTIEELQAPPPHRMYDEIDRPDTPGGPYSPSSTTSSGRWKEAPMRSQLLAAYVKPGSSLDERESAAVELWEAASGEQLGWEDHLVRAEGVRKWYSDVEVSDDDGTSIARGAFEKMPAVDGDDAGRAKMGKTGLEARKDSATAVGREEEKDVDRYDEVLAIAEARCGLKKNACRSKDLSGVLADLRG
ncbi:hypothetical protein LTR56_005484 [Elasticomyces elasticus]|nr:hypothetical protein LTR56_005484 [Elasticomyces elasticus]KAK3665391.1 hypothetical protein LTR22_003621 [Elasticomyces elasticus]KAK4929964.1 hypothetical protein LTR49_003591 [Elasticomyces elasticus]KAK5769225.1 hypothetical protein LTS12_000576 [Elasticomyces elasticus]